MARPSSPPEVTVLGAKGTLAGVGPIARSLGLRLERIEAIRVVPCPPRELARRLAPVGNVDAVFVPSRHAVSRTLARWARARACGPRPAVWAAGPGTAAALRRLGVPHVREGKGLGARAMVSRLAGRRHAVLYLRSDAAGDGLSTALRARGHRVTEVVGYRVRAARTRIRRGRAVIRGASALVFTSPSSVAALREALGRATVRHLGRATLAVVLGERSARAARGAGFRSVVVARTTDPQRFARLLVRTVADARR